MNKENLIWNCRFNLFLYAFNTLYEVFFRKNEIGMKKGLWLHNSLLFMRVSSGSVGGGALVLCCWFLSGGFSILKLFNFQPRTIYFYTMLTPPAWSNGAFKLQSVFEIKAEIPLLLFGKTLHLKFIIIKNNFWS